jgi:enoyl-CoA hydratase/carnithine racemase
VTSALRVEHDDAGIAEIVFDNPGKLNALPARDMVERLPALLQELDSDVSVRVVILRGAGGAFTSGADLESGLFERRSFEVVENDVRAAGRSVVTLWRLSKPSIAVVEGAAVGAGIALACGCDFRFVARSARFCAPFVRFGMAPDFGSSYLVPWAFGVQAGLEMLLTGRVVDAEEAVSLGFARRVSEDPLHDARELAAVLATNPPKAVTATRRLVQEGLRGDIEQIALEAEPAAVAASLGGDEFAERFGAYRAGVETRS